MNGLLVIVPCGKAKIWNRHPDSGRVRASDAYTGSLFKLNRQYAERFSERWVILSAKYGFIPPDFKIEDYDTTFKRKSPDLVADATLRQQIRRLGLNGYKTVVSLGGKDYRSRVEAVFTEVAVKPRFPFHNLPIGKAMQALKRAVERNDPFARRK
jgi:hypothetical protein